MSHPPPSPSAPPPQLEALPAWVALGLAQAHPREPDRQSLAGLQAFLELAVIRVLSEALQDLAALTFPVESAMRVTMSGRMTTRSWVDLLAGLEASGTLGPLGLPDPLPAPVVQVAGALGAPLDKGLVVGTVLRAVVDADPDELPDLTPMLVALTCGSSLAREPLVHILRVEGEVAELRELRGTGWSPVVRRTLPDAAPGLCFLREAGGVLPVPRWLMVRDDAAARVHVFAGRDGVSARWGYLTRQPPARIEEWDAPVGEVPVFLAEPTWGTPPPARRRAVEVPRDVTITQSMVVPRMAVPPRDVDATTGERTVVRVISGRDLMRYAVLQPDSALVIGRNTGFADFAVHHEQVSRSHARVRMGRDGRVFVQDLKSANGTWVGEVAVGTESEVEVRRGEVIAVGPVLLRVDGVTQEQESRLARIRRTRDGGAGRRDPLTGLLIPRRLVDELPDALRPGFSEGGGPSSPELWGALLYVDRLAALHAQHGERTADLVFHNVARLVQYAVEAPERVVRVGYGELLVPLVGVGQAGAFLTAEQLLGVVAEHVWPAPVQVVSLTAAVARKRPEEPAREWLKRARTALQAGRSKHGRNQVYQAD